MSDIDYEGVEAELIAQNKQIQRAESNKAVVEALGHLKGAGIEECMANQLWRLNHLYWIVDKDGAEIPFQMNVFQMELLSGMWYFNIILKARQLGFSTLIDIVALDTCLFTDNYAAGIIAHDLESAKELFSSNIDFPYQHLPEAIKQWRTATTENVRELKFENGSHIQVATSLRSGTNQFLHISEFGKICAKSYEKAREVVTGSIETVGIGNICLIESTAEGEGGFFYDYCQEAENAALQNKKLGMQDYKFWFFPWWREKTYRLDPGSVVVTDEDSAYFNEMEKAVGTLLEPSQRAWYITKRKKLSEDMTREYPGTAKEAFESAIEGTYLGTEMKALRASPRIRHIPLETGHPVFTFWDIGMDDYTAIWAMQYIFREYRFIRYYENNDAGAEHYAKELKRWADEYGYTYGKHYLPHDAKVRDWSVKGGQTRKQVLVALGVRPIKIVASPPGSFAEQVQACRTKLSQCWFDEQDCALGLQRLSGWKKSFDQANGQFKSTEKPDENTHGAAAFRMFAAGFSPPDTNATPLKYEQYEQAVKGVI